MTLKKSLLTMTLTSIAASTAIAAESPLGLTIDVNSSSAYIFRGYNLFQEEKQSDQNGMIAPSLSWSIGDTGLSVTYFSAYQLNGDNIEAGIDGGVGHEQDLNVTQSISLNDKTTLSMGIWAYTYPSASKSVSGTSNPTYLEPTIGISYNTVVTLGANIAYFRGLQEEIKDYSYTYLNTSVAKSLPLTKTVSFESALSVGYKYFDNQDVNVDKEYDSLLTLATPISYGNNGYIKPQIGVAWTNIDDTDTSDELAYYVSVNVGATI